MDSSSRSGVWGTLSWGVPWGTWDTLSPLPSILSFSKSYESGVGLCASSAPKLVISVCGPVGGGSSSESPDLSAPLSFSSFGSLSSTPSQQRVVFLSILRFLSLIFGADSLNLLLKALVLSVL
ncbi:hypothetical protein ES703_123601 [subsurface metagenome]